MFGVPYVGDTNAKVVVLGWVYNSIEKVGVELWGWWAWCGSTMFLCCAGRTVDGSAVLYPDKDTIVGVYPGGVWCVRYWLGGG